MANQIKITQLPINTIPSNLDVFPIVNSGVTKQLSLSGLTNFININNYLPLSGGTVTGALNFDNGSVTSDSGTVIANGFAINGGTNSQILVANGSVITAGSNIVIDNNQISSVGGGSSVIVGDSGDGSTVRCGNYNSASNDYTTVSGGRYNTASGQYSTVSGGRHNVSSCRYSTVSGGFFNTASGGYSSVVGGSCNTVSGYVTYVGGGRYNTASNSYTTISGGRYNCVTGNNSAIAGGSGNVVNGQYSFAVGNGNTVSGNYSAAIGVELNAICDGTLYVNNICAISCMYGNLPSSSIISSLGYTPQPVIDGNSTIGLNGDGTIDGGGILHPQGLYLSSPNGSIYKLCISDGGDLSVIYISGGG